ncbi:MAG: cyclic nucleotide-binding domain-containing protein, partial [Leptolyngbyaceae cyanobacterium bins.302]|nr:cyclic nucleotide-binding domain-containing protein [Leptolyngbyaceae cyanobacterium bins.302]
MLAEGELPSAVYCVVQGRVRLLGSVSEQLPTLAVVDEGSVVGWEALVRRTAYGSVRAAGLEPEVLALVLSADDFEQLLLNDLLPKLEQQVGVLELYDVLSCFLANVPTQLKLPDLKTIASYIEQHQLAVARHSFPTEQAEPLLSGYVWFVSGGVSVSVSKGMPIINLQQVISQKTSPFPVRLIGIDRKILALVLTTGILPVDPVEVEVSSQQASAADAVLTHLENLLVPELIPSQQVLLEQAARKSYPVHLARSADAAEYVVACFWSVCDYLQIPYRPDLLRRRFSSSKDDFGDR